MKINKLALLSLAGLAQAQDISLQYATHVRDNAWNTPVSMRIDYSDKNVTVKYNPFNKLYDPASTNEASVDLRSGGFSLMLRNSFELGRGIGIGFADTLDGTDVKAIAVKFPHWIYGYAQADSGNWHANFGGRYDSKNKKFHPAGYVSHGDGRWHFGAGRTRFDTWWANTGYTSKDFGMIGMNDFGSGVNLDYFLAFGDTADMYSAATQQIVTRDDIIPKTKAETFNFPPSTETGKWTTRTRFFSKGENRYFSNITGRRVKSKYLDAGLGAGIDYKKGFGPAGEAYLELHAGRLRIQPSYSFRPKSKEGGLLVRILYSRNQK